MLLKVNLFIKSLFTKPKVNKNFVKLCVCFHFKVINTQLQFLFEIIFRIYKKISLDLCVLS